MRDQLKHTPFSKHQPFFFFLLFLLAAHLLLPLNWGDDSVFSAEASAKTLSAFLAGSSRPLTDGMTYLFSRYKLAWRVVNTFIIVLFAVTICRLLPFACERRQKWLICFAALYPVMFLVEAGFIATTVNYLWPITFGLIALLPLRSLLLGIRNRWYDSLFACIALFYALNMEQMCAVLCFLFLAGIAGLLYKKRMHWFPVLQLFICAAGTYFSYYLNTAGSGSRVEREIERYFPSFLELSLLQKTELGFSATCYSLIMEISPASIAFLAFTAFLAYAMLKKTNRTWKRGIALIPGAATLFFQICALPPLRSASVLQTLTGGMVNYKMAHAVYALRLLPDLLFCLMLACIISVFFLLIQPAAKRLCMLTIFAAGLGSRVLMGFSPTIWASGYRTFQILILSFLFCALFILISDQTDYRRDNAPHTGVKRAQNLPA